MPPRRGRLEIRGIIRFTLVPGGSPPRDAYREAATWRARRYGNNRLHTRHALALRRRGPTWEGRGPTKTALYIASGLRAIRRLSRMLLTDGAIVEELARGEMVDGDTELADRRCGGVVTGTTAGIDDEAFERPLRVRTMVAEMGRE